MRRDDTGHNGSRLCLIGALWKPKPCARSRGTGGLTINGYKQRFVVLRNDRTTEGSRRPDNVLLRGDDPEPDDYTAPDIAAHTSGHSDADDSGDIPF